MSAPFLTQATLHRLLNYDPATGTFTWRHRDDVRPQWNGRYAGKEAGFPWSQPNSNVTYRSIRIFDWPFMAHRLAVLYMTGAWPENDVDHRDLDGLNNRWLNLRPATKSQNGHNKIVQKNNKVGLKGVSLSKGRYRATIVVDGRQVWLGYHDTPEKAHAAYCKAVRYYRPEYGRTA